MEGNVLLGLRDLLDKNANIEIGGETVFGDVVDKFVRDFKFMLTSDAKVYDIVHKGCDGINSIITTTAGEALDKYEEGNHIVFFDTANCYVVFKNLGKVDETMNKIKTGFSEGNMDVKLYNVIKANNHHKFAFILSDQCTESDLDKLYWPLKKAFSYSNGDGTLIMLDKETIIVMEKTIGSIQDNAYKHHKKLIREFPSLAPMCKDLRMEGEEDDELLYLQCTNKVFDVLSSEKKGSKFIKWSEVLERSGMIGSGKIQLSVMINGNINGNFSMMNTGNNTVIQSPTVVSERHVHKDDIVREYIRNNDPNNKTMADYYDNYVRAHGKNHSKKAFCKIVRSNNYESINIRNKRVWTSSCN